jgi:RNA-directed DNA polymerase
MANPGHAAIPHPTLRALQTPADVAQILGVSEKYLTFLLYGPTHKRSYTRFSIPKKAGGTRSISSPPGPIRALQAKLKRVFELVYEPKVSVHGFVKNRSILTNALPHVRKQWVLNVDLHAFFPSIHFGRVRGMLIAKPYAVGAGAASVLARICCDGDRLPQGAPTSPVIANMVCARLDGQLLQLARRSNCMYTRYADDLSFSTRKREFPDELARPDGGWTGRKVKLGSALVKVLRTNGFFANEDKTRLQFKTLHQDVTGIVVNQGPNVRRSFVRQIRAMIHAWEKYGLTAAEQHFHDRYDKRVRHPNTHRPAFRLVLKGKIDYLQMVRGKADRIFRRLRNRLHDLDPALVKDALPILPEAGPIEEVWKHWAREYRQAVYHLEVTTPDGDLKGGTAFSFRRGFLATAEHVIVGTVTVGMPLPASVVIIRIGVHPLGPKGIDVAVLNLPIERVGTPFLPTDSTLPEIGDPVAVLGYPSVPYRQPAFGLYPGRVESITRDYRGNVFIQIGGDLAGGMSGAPLINAAGAVIGVVSEQTFEQTAPDVPARAYQQVLPIRHLSEVNLDQLMDATQYVRPGGGLFAQGLRKLFGRIGRAIIPM